MHGRVVCVAGRACMAGGMNGEHMWWGVNGRGAYVGGCTTRYGDKVNEQAVHILLECILVTICNEVVKVKFL